jgi:hypothetical protein
VFVALTLAAGTFAFLIVNMLEQNDVRGGVDSEVATGAGDVSMTGASAAAVHDYVAFARVLDETRIDESSLEPSSIADGLRKLAGALGALNIGDPELPVDLRVTAEHVLLNPASPATTAAVRTGLVKAAAAIAAERQDPAASLHAAAEAIDEASPLTSQPATVRQFLRQSADALERVTANARS